ncbi:hypothetical protein [Flavobacterium frigoris]|uniref:Uncharacterized protein n=1 Tax=Flavobacterium frigoris TaxID=229204 RepID=A0A1H9S186_FLAFI|nr:hypothetical protein [Flavobacterium frigoris]SER78747.1 hypothetical protein SAMN05444355_1362 [Flavobacterium frigoris]
MKTTTPLSIILEWFHSLDEKIQDELLSLCLIFHYDESIRNEHISAEKINKIKNYLNDNSLTNNEIITRALFITRLFDYAFNGRDNEEDWDESMDRNLDARNRMVQKGHSGDFIDNALEDWQHRKYFWINLASSWNKLKVEYLEISKLEKWWMQNLK